MRDTNLILFDLNGVLYDYRRDARIARLAALSGQSRDAVRSAIWDTGFEDSGDAGDLDPAAYLQGFGERIGHGLTEADWVEAVHASVTPIPDMLRLLSRLRPDLRCAVLTNNNLLVKRHFADLFPEVAQRIGGNVTVSAEFGLRKPDPDCYRRCLRWLDAAPEETWFVDDSLANVTGARRAGLMTHHYRNPRRFAAELRRRHLLAAEPQTA